MSFQYVALVPGLPHILTADKHAAYAELSSAASAVGDAMAAAGIRRVLYASTQWLSVLGYMVQAKARLSGRHVDENWHDLADVGCLDFDFIVDPALASSLVEALQAADLQARLVDYDGFPVDTGTIVADRLINRGRFTCGMISTWVYADAAATESLWRIVSAALANDPVPTALVVVSGLSGRYFTTEIDLREDRLSDPADDVWNRRVLELLDRGRGAELKRIGPTFARECKADMGFKLLAVLEGAGIFERSFNIQTLAYGPIYGTGAAVVACVPRSF